MDNRLKTKNKIMSNLNLIIRNIKKSNLSKCLLWLIKIKIITICYLTVNKKLKDYNPMIKIYKILISIKIIL